MLGSLRRFIDSLTRGYLSLSKIILVVLIVVFAGQTYSAPFNSFFDKCERGALDLRMRTRPAQFTQPKVVIIEIDLKTVESMGRPPWTNEKFAILVNALSGMGAKSIVFDFPISRSSGAEGDALFVDAIVKAGNVYLPITFSQIKGLVASGTTAASLGPLRDAAAGEGHIHCVPDDDGVFRRVKPRLWFGAREVLQLGFRTALDSYGVDSRSAIYRTNEIEVAVPSNPPIRIPLTSEGELILNYPGKWSASFRHVSLVDAVLSYEQVRSGQVPRIPADTFEDAFCVVGITAQGLYDPRKTPLEKAVPLVAVTATVLNSALERSFIYTPKENSGAAIIWVFCAIIVLIVIISGFAQSLVRLFLLTLFYGALVHLSFIFANTVLPAARPAAAVLFAFIALATLHQVSTVFERRRLMRLVVKDALTGLYNYEHFKLLLSAEVGNIALRRNKWVSIIMVDIDFFKRINDTLGHPAGDEVIRGMAEILRNNCRSLDVACRYGGEEFVLMLPGAQPEEAGKIAERIRKAFEDRKFELGESKVSPKITASFGVATFYPKETVDEFVRRADKALYKAKEAGRNMVCRV